MYKFYRTVVHLVPNFVICHSNVLCLCKVYIILCVIIIQYIPWIYVVRYQWQGVFISFFARITFSMQCWLTMIFLAEPPSPNHHTVSAVPVDRRGVIRVSWTAPTVSGGELPITGYNIRYKVQNGTSFKYTSVTSIYVSAMITGLNPGAVYRVYVAGVSAIGRGPYCCEGTPVLVTTYNGKLHHEQVLICCVSF